jgi:hypothetical protein
MTDTDKTVLAPVTRRSAGAGIVNVASDLDKADIVAIAAVRFEEQLEAAKIGINRQTAGLNGQIEGGEAALRKACDELAHAHDTAGPAAAAKSLKDAGFGTYEASVDLEQIDENRQQVTLRVALHPRGSASRSAYGSAMEKRVTVPFSTEAKKLLKSLRADRQAMADLSKQLAEVHKKLSGIPALERKARAKLAENALAGSEEGRKILEQLMSVTDGSLPQFLLADGR